MIIVISRSTMYEYFVDIFGGSSQNWTIFRGHFYALKCLFLMSSHRMGNIFFWLLKVKNSKIFRVLEILDIFLGER